MKRIHQLLLVCFLSISSFVFAGGAGSAWSRLYGTDSIDFDNLNALQETSDLGYILAGSTFAYGAGGGDFWVVKTDGLGNLQWQKTYGGSNEDDAWSIQQTSDGGYIVGGQTFSFGAGSYDAWVIRLDSSGNPLWQKTFGSDQADAFFSVIQTSDQGYVLAGTYAQTLAWIIRLDASGNVQWQKIVVGTGAAKSIQQTADGGFIGAGYSFGPGTYDFSIFKLDSSGNVQWQKAFDGGQVEIPNSIKQTTDGGYIVAGGTGSFGAGGIDAWIMKLDSAGTPQWQKTYGGFDYDFAYSIRQTSDGGYIAVGATSSFSTPPEDGWILKLDSTGNVQWQKDFAGPGQDFLNDVQQSSDGGYIFGGLHSNNELWLIKTDSSGIISSSCDFITDTSITPANSTAVAVDSQGPAMDSSVVPANTNVVATNSPATDAVQCSNAGPTCAFSDDFEDGVVDPSKWTVIKTAFTENSGDLVGTPTGKKAIILTNGFSGCTNCSFKTTMQTAGGISNRVWLLAWYLDKRNTVELLMKEESDKWILKYKSNGSVIKAKTIQTIDPNVAYDVELGFDGTSLHFFLNGIEVITLQAPVTPNNIFGYEAKATTARFSDVCIESND